MFLQSIVTSSGVVYKLIRVLIGNFLNSSIVMLDYGFFEFFLIGGLR